MVFYNCHGFWETGIRRAKRERSFLARENILVLPEREEEGFALKLQVRTEKFPLPEEMKRKVCWDLWCVTVDSEGSEDLNELRGLKSLMFLREPESSGF